MKIKTFELTGRALDWAVAKCEGGVEVNNLSDYGSHYSPSTDWSKGGPIIQREEIHVFAQYPCSPLTEHTKWNGRLGGYRSQCTGPTPLIAAMRSYVTSKLGTEIEIPEGLV